MRIPTAIAVLSWVVAISAIAGTNNTPNSAPDQMIVTIVDATTGKPIPNANVVVQAYLRDRPIPQPPPNSCPVIPKRTLSCDDTGKVIVPLSQLRLRFIRVIAAHDGYAKHQVQWTGDENGRHLPDKYTLKLEPAINIGGVITDPAGKPLAGATVSVAKTFRSQDFGPVQDYSLVNESTVTDNQGRWSIGSVPADAKEIIVSASHNGFIDDRLYNHDQQLKDHSAILQLKPGVSLTGRVVDDAGHPIESAQVLWDPQFSRSCRTSTAADGTFTLDTVDPDGGDVLVRAKGKAPFLRHVTPKSADNSDFVLKKAQVFAGTVVDTSGHPIADASVSVTEWAGHRWPRIISADTDTNGKFSFDGPDEPLMVEVYSSGYLQEQSKGISPQNEPFKFVLRHPLKVIGSVTDAESGKPIEHFKVTQGWGIDGMIDWALSDGTKDGFDGRYETNFTFDRGWGQPFRLRIQADGYAPVSSDAIENSAENDGKTITFDAKLHRAAGISGVVVDRAGTPVAAADVVFATPDSQTSISNGRIDQQNFSATTKSDADGRFYFPPHNTTFAIIVLTDSGFAQVSQEQFSKDAKVVIAPWGRIEGKMMIGPKPASGATAEIWEPQHPYPQRPNDLNLSISWEAIADQEGHFTMERVTPGLHRIGRQIPLPDRSWTIGFRQKITITAGQTATLQLGGTGRSVVGKFHVPDNLPKPWNFEFVQLGEPIPPMPQPEYPPAWFAMPSQLQYAWRIAWSHSPEVRAIWKEIEAARARNEPYSFAVNSDNSFRIDDVKPGRYQFTGFIEPSLEPGMPGWGKRLANIDSLLTVENGAGDLNIGTIEVKPPDPAQ